MSRATTEWILEKLSTRDRGALESMAQSNGVGEQEILNEAVDVLFDNWKNQSDPLEPLHVYLREGVSDYLRNGKRS